MQRRAKGGKVDYLGILCLVVGLGAMQIVLDRGQRADWFAAPWVWYFTAISAGALILLIIHELRFSEPILDLRIMGIAAFDLSVSLQVAMSFALYGTGLLNPIFLQEFMGYTAWRAGLVLAPRGLGTMFSMMLIGQLARFRFDTRPLVGLGFVMMAVSLWTMSKWNLNVSTWVVIWPSLVMGVGMGLIFPTLSAATLSVVNRERMGYAASLYNMMRNAGAAVGISYMTTALINHQQVHQSYLVAHFSIFDAWRMSNAAPRMAGVPRFSYLPEMVGGNHGGFAGVYGMIQSQAAMLSFNDIYRMLAIGMAILIPSFLMLRRVGAGSGGAAH